MSCYIGGWGDETNREIVSCRAVRACVRARALVVRWNFGSNVRPGFSLFPFLERRPFPFPLRDYSEPR